MAQGYNNERYNVGWTHYYKLLRFTCDHCMIKTNICTHDITEQQNKN